MALNAYKAWNSNPSHRDMTSCGLVIARLQNTVPIFRHFIKDFPEPDIARLIQLGPHELIVGCIQGYEVTLEVLEHLAEYDLDNIFSNFRQTGREDIGAHFIEFTGRVLDVSPDLLQEYSSTMKPRTRQALLHPNVCLSAIYSLEIPLTTDYLRFVRIMEYPNRSQK